MRWQADACRELGSPLYGDLLRHASADLPGRRSDRGGPAWPSGRPAVERARAPAARGRARARAVRSGTGGLAAFYPSAGGTVESAPGSPRAWTALKRTFAEQAEEIRTWLDHPPQTNEVGRAAALLGGLRHIAAEEPLPIRLVEVGASAGLNLRADHFYVPGDAGSYGAPDSPVVLAGGWQGEAPPQSHIEVVERVGGDAHPSIRLHLAAGCGSLPMSGRIRPTASAGCAARSSWPRKCRRSCEPSRHQPPSHGLSWYRAAGRCSGTPSSGSTSARTSGRSSPAGLPRSVPQPRHQRDSPTSTWSSRVLAAVPSPWRPGRAGTAGSSGPHRRTGCLCSGRRAPDRVTSAACFPSSSLAMTRTRQPGL